MSDLFPSVNRIQVSKVNSFTIYKHSVFVQQFFKKKKKSKFKVF